jgi:quinol monooxygenase YgiN
MPIFVAAHSLKTSLARSTSLRIVRGKIDSPQAKASYPDDGPPAPAKSEPAEFCTLCGSSQQFNASISDAAHISSDDGPECRQYERENEVALFICGRLHAWEGHAEAVAAALRQVVGPTRAEPGCLDYGAFCSTGDPRLFYIHSRWIDEAAFDAPATLPYTERLLAQVQQRIEHPLDVTRARPID